MRFKKLNSKNVILSMILCYIASFSLLNADNLKECQSEEDTQTGCVVKVYDESGNLLIERPYKNGKVEGIEKHYYESGDIHAEIPYTNDKINGIVKFYDSGNLQNERPYKNGKAEGIEKHYYESGDILAEIPYTNDKINGIVKFYDKGKKLIWQATAQNGKLISGKCVSGKVMTNAHLTRLTNEIDELEIGGAYWHDICKK